MEHPLRQRHLDRLALARLARNADGAEPHHHFRARPKGARRDRRWYARRRRRWRSAAVAGPPAAEARACAERGRGPRGAGEVGAGAGEPEPVLSPVGERQRAAEVGARLLGRDDRRTARGRDREDDAAAGSPPRRIVALPGPWIVHRFSVGASRRALAGGCGVAFWPGGARVASLFCSGEAIPPSTRVATTVGSPRTTRTESSGTVSVCGSAVLKSMTTGGWPA